MRVGVPGEFHEDRWQRTAEDSERRLLPRTREAGGSHRIQVISCLRVLLTGLRHDDPTYRYLRDILAWRRGTSDRSPARRPYPQVPQGHPRVAKKASGRASARSPCPQVPQSHPRVAKGASDRSSARRPCPQVLQRHPRVAKKASGRASARPPCPQMPQGHPGVAKEASDRSSARRSCLQAPQSHPGVPKRSQSGKKQ